MRGAVRVAFACAAVVAAQDFGSFGKLRSTLPLGFRGYDLYVAEAPRTAYVTRGATSGKVYMYDTSGTGELAWLPAEADAGGLQGVYAIRGAVGGPAASRLCGFVSLGPAGVAVGDITAPRAFLATDVLTTTPPSLSSAALDASDSAVVTAGEFGFVSQYAVDRSTCATALDYTVNISAVAPCSAKGTGIVADASRAVVYVACAEGYIAIVGAEGQLGLMNVPGSAPTGVKQLRWDNGRTLVAVMSADAVHFAAVDGGLAGPRLVGAVAVDDPRGVTQPEHIDDILYVCAPAGLLRIDIRDMAAVRVTETVATVAPCTSALHLNKQLFVLHGFYLTAARQVESWTFPYFDECSPNNTCATCANTTCGGVGQGCLDPQPDTVRLGDWVCTCTPPATGAPAVRGPASCRTYALAPAVRADVGTLGADGNGVWSAVVIAGVVGSTGSAAARVPFLRDFACGAHAPLTATPRPEPLDHAFNPLRVVNVSVGPGNAAHLVTAILLNFLLVVACAAAMFINALIIRTVEKTPLSEAINIATLPGCLFFPYALVLHGTTHAAMRLVLLDDVSNGYTLLGVVTLVVVAISIIGVVLGVVRRVPADAHEVDDPRLSPFEGVAAVCKDLTPLEGWRRRVYVFLFGTKILVTTTRETYFTERYGVIFDRLRQGRAWFAAVELLVTVVLALLVHWDPASRSGCAVRNFIITAVLLAFWVAVSFLKPYYSTWNNLLHGALASSAFSCMLCMSLRLALASDNTSSVSVSNGFADAAVAFLWTAVVALIVKIAWEVASRIYDLASGRQWRVRRAWQAYEDPDNIAVTVLSPEERGQYSPLSMDHVLRSAVPTLLNPTSVDVPPCAPPSLADGGPSVRTEAPPTLDTPPQRRYKPPSLRQAPSTTGFSKKGPDA